jgi:hypothetical protein
VSGIIAPGTVAVPTVLSIAGLASGPETLRDRLILAALTAVLGRESSTFVSVDVLARSAVAAADAALRQRAAQPTAPATPASEPSGQQTG